GPSGGGPVREAGPRPVPPSASPTGCGHPLGGSPVPRLCLVRRRASAGAAPCTGDRALRAGCAPARPPLSRLPPKAGRRRRRRERASRSAARAPLVVDAWSDVVGGVRMEERGEILDLAAARPKLELAAPVQADAPAGAVV